MRLVIVTGMSGAGKTTALKTLEDMGFYCADNLPVLLIEKFAELVMNGQSEKQDIALGVDVRSGEELPNLEIIIRKWRENKYPFSILFLDSSDEVLIKRFKETRRSHPLSRNGRVEKGIELEREKLAFLKKEADHIMKKLLILLLMCMTLIPASGKESQERWHHNKYSMFIHFGLYSELGHAIHSA